MFRLITIWFGRLAVFVVAVAAWQCGVSSGRLDKLAFSSPSDVWSQLGKSLSTTATVHNILLTLEEAVVGFAVGAAAAIAIVLAFTLWAILGEAIAPVLGVFNSVPRMAIAPLFIVWFGLGLTPKVVLVFTIVFFVVFFNLMAGIKTIEPTLISNLHIQGANRMQLTAHLYLPAVFGWLMSGLRTSVGFAFASAVVAEYLGSNAGLGYVIFFAIARYKPGEAFAGIIIMVAFVLLMTGLVELLRRKFRHWEIGYNGS